MSSSLKPGAVLDGYRIVRFLGSGGFGEVWLCRSDALGDFRALKWIPASGQEELEREYQALVRYRSSAAKLRSPHLIAIEHANRVEDGLFYVMPLADDARPGVDPSSDTWRPFTLGRMLQDKREIGTWFTTAEIQAIIVPVLSGLQILSDAGFVHRDVKPDNILFYHGIPCLADISLLGEDGHAVTRCGTPGYVTPTWYEGGHPDMYGAAATLYSLLTGNFPDKMGRAAFLWPPGGETSLPPSEQAEWKRLHAVIRRATEERVGERYPNFAAMGQAIAGAGADVGPDRGRGHRVWRNATRAAVVAVSALIFAGVHLWNHKNSSGMPATEPHVRPSPSVPLDESTLSFKIYDIIVDVCVDVLELESYEMFRDPGATQALKVLNENIFQAAAKGDGKTVASLIKGFGEIEPRYKNLPSLRFLERALLVQVGDAKKLAPDQEGLALVESNVPDVSPLQKARLLKIAAEPALTERFLSKVILQIETQQKDLSALYLMRGEIRAAANDRKGFLEDRRAAFLMTPDPTPEEVDARSLGAKIGEELKYLPTEFEKARNNWDLLEKKFSALRITPEERENRPAYSPPTLEEIPAIPVNGVAMVDMDSRYLVMDLTWKLVRFAGAKKNLPVEVNAEIEKKSERLREYLEKRNDLRAAHEEFESLAKIIGPVGQLPSYRLITAWYLCAQGITGKACAILQDPSLLEFGDDVFPGAKINLFNHLWNTPLAERFVTKFMESKKDNASLLLFRAKLRARLRNFPGFEKDMNQALSNFRQQKPDATKSGTRNFLRPWQEIMKQFPGCSGYQREYAATR